MMRFAAVFMMLACAALSHSCSDDEKDPITVRIFSYGADFSGTYIFNGGTAVTIPSCEKKEVLYYWEHTFEDLDQVEVDVKTGGTATFVAVRIYRDGARVKEAVNSSSSGAELTAYLTYTYDEEDVSGD